MSRGRWHPAPTLAVRRSLDARNEAAADAFNATQESRPETWVPTTCDAAEAERKRLGALHQECIAAISAHRMWDAERQARVAEAESVLARLRRVKTWLMEEGERRGNAYILAIVRRLVDTLDRVAEDVPEVRFTQDEEDAIDRAAKWLEQHGDAGDESE